MTVDYNKDQLNDNKTIVTKDSDIFIINKNGPNFAHTNDSFLDIL